MTIDEYRRALVEKLAPYHIPIEVIGDLVGLAAEDRMQITNQSYERGYNIGYGVAKAKSQEKILSEYPNPLSMNMVVKCSCGCGIESPIICGTEYPFFRHCIKQLIEMGWTVVSPSSGSSDDTEYYAPGCQGIGYLVS